MERLLFIAAIAALALGLALSELARLSGQEASRQRELEITHELAAVSYTHLTLPTIYSV